MNTAASGVNTAAVAEALDAPAIARPQGSSGRGFVPLVFGGLLAGGIGFAGGQFLGAVPDTGADTRLRTLEQTVEGLPAVDPDLPGRVEALAAEVAAIRDAEPAAAASPEAVADLSETVAALETRIAGIEARPASAPTAASDTADASTSGVLDAPRQGTADLEAFRTELAGQAEALAALTARADEIGSRTDSLVAETAALSEQTAALSERGTSVSSEVAAQAALLRVEAALESGGPFGAALDELEATGATLPDGLRDEAGGLPTLLELERMFPPLARAALDASVKATVGEGTTERVTAFLRTQLGARSLTAREGNDPDAVLSRAEAALRDGALAQALTEIGTLPAEGQAALAEWTALANRRLVAQNAVVALSDTLQTN